MMKTIFIVDDNETNRVTAKTALEGDYKTYALPSASRLFAFLEKIIPDLILLDIEMPEMDGFEALTLLKADKKLKTIPVIFLTSKSDEEFEIRGFEIGAIDFINKPFSTLVLRKRIETHIEIDKLVKRSLQSVKNVYNATIRNLAGIVESRDDVTGGHISRTHHYLLILATELITSGIYKEQVAEWDLDLLIPSAQLHDAGKVRVSDTILNKPAKLTPEEFNAIKRHCEDGASIIDRIIHDAGEDSDDFLTYAKSFAQYHHEKWNGTGYPQGLAGEDIPLQGRLMAIVDVYDALVSERPY